MDKTFEAILQVAPEVASECIAEGILGHTIAIGVWTVLAILFMFGGTGTLIAAIKTSCERLFAISAILGLCMLFLLALVGFELYNLYVIEHFPHLYVTEEIAGMIGKGN